MNSTQEPCFADLVRAREAQQQKLRQELEAQNKSLRKQLQTTVRLTLGLIAMFLQVHPCPLQSELLRLLFHIPSCPQQPIWTPPSAASTDPVASTNISANQILEIKQMFADLTNTNAGRTTGDDSEVRFASS